MTRGIAVVGAMHSGKSTAARYLVEHHGFERIALADAVKDEAADLLNHAVTLYNDQWGYRLGKLATAVFDREAINQNKEVHRTLLQWLGTEFWREYMGDPTHWIDIFIEKVARATNPIVCDDVRFLNEAASLRRLGFLIVRVTRDEDDRTGSVEATGQQGIAGHASEIELRQIVADVNVYNDTIKNLEERLEQVLRSCGLATREVALATESR